MKKEDIIKVLEENTKRVGDHNTNNIHSCRFEEIAESLVKLCNSPFVVVSDCDCGFTTLNKNEKVCKLYCAVKKEEWEK